jgi:L-threonylcarbamoyladenylate synthase
MSNGPAPELESATQVLDMGLDDTISRAVETLLGGGVISFPTDTVYALAASLTHPAALARLFQIKRRSLAKPIPVLLAAPGGLANVAQVADPKTIQFVATFWPGQLTVILPSRDEMPDAVTGHDELGRRTVAVRIPDHAQARSLIERAGGAVAATSANRSGYVPGLTANEVAGQLGPSVDLILDGGRAYGGVASTIVELGSTGPHVLRAGSVSDAQLEQRWASLKS